VRLLALLGVEGARVVEPAARERPRIEAGGEKKKPLEALGLEGVVNQFRVRPPQVMAPSPRTQSDDDEADEEADERMRHLTNVAART
jgi:hypothetical protein